MASVTPDMPDYQRGTVSAQKLLGSSTSATGTLQVGVPANAESLLIVIVGFTTINSIPTAGGVQTGAAYSVTGVYDHGQPVDAVYAVPAVSPLDSEVNVTVDLTGSGTWYVVADSHARITSDPQLSYVINQAGQPATEFGYEVMLRNPGGIREWEGDTQGRGIVVPGIPGTGSNDHPPVEVTNLLVGPLTNEQVVLDTPPATERYRVFSVRVIPVSPAASDLVVLRGGGTLGFGSGIGPVYGHTVFPAQGMACVAGTAITLQSSSASTQYYVEIVYTVEAA